MEGSTIELTAAFRGCRSEAGGDRAGALLLIVRSGRLVLPGAPVSGQTRPRRRGLLGRCVVPSGGLARLSIRGIVFFRLPSFALGLLLFAVILGATGVGVFLGHRVRHLSGSLKEPFGILQGALLGLVGLILAFGLSLAVSRYEARRANIVSEANAIGTTYLRAQTLAEPIRSRSLDLLIRYTRSAVHLSDRVPGSEEEHQAAIVEERLQRQLWALAGEALATAPTASAPRLYVEALNDMLDAENVRVAALNNRVPMAVLVLEVLGSALALGLLGAYLMMVGRGVLAVSLASIVVAFLLLVTVDLDRPTRGMIRIPDDVLADQLASMTKPPAAAAPNSQTP